MLHVGFLIKCEYKIFVALNFVTLLRVDEKKTHRKYYKVLLLTFTQTHKNKNNL